MKIMVLEHPRIASKKRFNDIANTPLWSCLMGGYAAASLEQAGFDTRFVDHAVPGMTFETTRNTIQAFDPGTRKKNLDIFPCPKRASLDGTVTLLASRGCYNHCSFCPVPSFYNQGSLWQGRSPENIAKEMQELVDQGVNQFYFADPNFIGPGAAGKKRAMDLMDLIQPMGITFGMEKRPQDLTDPILEKLVNAGFTSLLMGVESGSKAVLNSINKSSATDVGANAITLCRKHGIEPEVGFLMFVPDSSLDDLGRNMNFLMKNTLLDRLARAANLLCHCQIVLAGTSGYAGFEKQNRLIKNGIFDFEAEVAFSDPGVEWMAHCVTFACHTVLRAMSRKDSPVYWDKDDTQEAQQLNEFLKNLFF